jgi:hypothetical protein
MPQVRVNIGDDEVTSYREFVVDVDVTWSEAEPDVGLLVQVENWEVISITEVDGKDIPDDRGQVMSLWDALETRIDIAVDDLAGPEDDFVDG